MLCVLSESDYSCCIVGQMPCLQPYMAWTCSYIALCSLLESILTLSLSTNFEAGLFCIVLFTHIQWMMENACDSNKILFTRRGLWGDDPISIQWVLQKALSCFKESPLSSLHKYFTVIFLFLQIAICFTASLFTIPTMKNRVLFKCYSNAALDIPTTNKVL